MLIELSKWIFPQTGKFGESKFFFICSKNLRMDVLFQFLKETNRIGSIVASLATGPNPVTTTVIPSKSESLFLKLVSEKISTRMRGIALVSASIQKDLEPDTAKGLMSELMNMIEND